MNILGIITARGGSKGIPKKNLRKISGVPLIEYTVKSALQSKKITRLIVSTDSQEIIKLAQKLQVEVPFRRPAKYARGDTSSVDVICTCFRIFKKI